MKKTLKTLVALFLILCLFPAALAETFYTPIALRTAETTEPLTVGEDGLVRDPSGKVYGATKAYDEWVRRMQAQGFATNSVAYRPLSVVDGNVYSDVNGALIGRLTGIASTAELGDSPVGVSAIIAAAAVALSAAIVAGRRRRAYSR